MVPLGLNKPYALLLRQTHKTGSSQYAERFYLWKNMLQYLPIFLFGPKSRMSSAGVHVLFDLKVWETPLRSSLLKHVSQQEVVSATDYRSQ